MPNFGNDSGSVYSAASGGCWPLCTAIHNGHYAQYPVMNSWLVARERGAS